MRGEDARRARTGLRDRRRRRRARGRSERAASMPAPITSVVPSGCESCPPARARSAAIPTASSTARAPSAAASRDPRWRGMPARRGRTRRAGPAAARPVRAIASSSSASEASTSPVVATSARRRPRARGAASATRPAPTSVPAAPFSTASTCMNPKSATASAIRPHRLARRALARVGPSRSMGARSAVCVLMTRSSHDWAPGRAVDRMLLAAVRAPPIGGGDAGVPPRCRAPRRGRTRRARASGSAPLQSSPRSAWRTSRARPPAAASAAASTAPARRRARAGAHGGPASTDAARPNTSAEAPSTTITEAPSRCPVSRSGSASARLGPGRRAARRRARARPRGRSGRRGPPATRCGAPRDHARGLGEVIREVAQGAVQARRPEAPGVPAARQVERAGTPARAGRAATRRVATRGRGVRRRGRCAPPLSRRRLAGAVSSAEKRWTSAASWSTVAGVWR